MKFVSPEVNAFDSRSRQCASYVRKSFSVREGLSKASLKMTALGVYVPYLNGDRIDAAMLLPGFTDYDHRVQARKFDLTNRLHMG